MDDIKVFIQEEVMNLAFKKVGFDESLVKSKLLDSISTVDLLVAIEEKIGKQVPQHLFIEENCESIFDLYETWSRCVYFYLCVALAASLYSFCRNYGLFFII